MKPFALSTGQVKVVHKAVDSLFDKVVARFLGREPGDKRIFIGFKPRVTLPSLYEAAAREEGVWKVDEQVRQGLLRVAEGFIEAQRHATKSQVVKAVEAWVGEARARGERADPAAVLRGELSDVFGRAVGGLKRILETEATHARNTGALDGIVRINAARGVKDPTVYFVVVNDEHLCSECRRLHLLEDGVTPRLWKLSQLGRGYHKKGQVSPKLGGLHPNCLTGSMRLHTDRGLVTLEELFREGGAVGVVVDARVKNRRVGNNQFGEEVPGEVWFHRHIQGARVMSATHVYDTGVQECLRITLDNGVVLEVSLGHEMWVDDGKSGMKVRADQLAIGDKVPLLSGEGVWGSDHFPELAELMGNLVGDGSISSTASWNFFGNDIAYGERLKKMAAAFSKRLEGPLVAHEPNTKYRVRYASFNSQRLARVFIKEFGLSKKPRRVPKRLWRADAETVAAFLRGLYAADGHSESTPSVILAQNDKSFLLEIQLLLSNFGIRSRLFDHGEGGEKQIAYADGSVFDAQRKPCWRLAIGGWAQVALFAEKIGLGVPAKQAALLERLRLREADTRLGAWRTAHVVSIEPIGEQQTYCLTEPMTNTVTAQGVVTGNCRCSLVTLMPGYGLVGGAPTFIALDHDEYAKQGGL